MSSQQWSNWWRHGIIYQIYPRSFADSSGDGIGDLPGITSRLSYCASLGVDAIWLSPIYPSPMKDFGYDISNYTDIDPIFGTLDDFDHLVQTAHELGLKVLLDYVPNHSSDQHPWFLASRSSRSNNHRDWYIWRDPAPGGGPPNNWLSVFGGSAWTWDSRTEQYYFHSYLREQPDLNWRNPALQEAMLGVLKFWLNRGVDGFRVDAISRLIKDDQFRDNPANSNYSADQGPYHQFLAEYSADRPEVHTIIRRMRRILDDYGGRLMIGEAYLPMDRLIRYYGSEEPGVDFPFNFHLIKLPWDARRLADAIQNYEGSLQDHRWPNWVLGNHDRHRIATRVGRQQARVAAMMLLTLRGTPTMYYGDEIGMQDVPIPPELVQDPWEKNVPGLGLGRDPERTPMQWDTTSSAGFSTAKPWLPIAPDFREYNVAVQESDHRSMLQLYRDLIALRKEIRPLFAGDFRLVDANDAAIAFTRTAGEQTIFVGLNLTDRPATVQLPSGRTARPLMTTLDEVATLSYSGNVHLRPDEGLIAQLD